MKLISIDVDSKQLGFIFEYDKDKQDDVILFMKQYLGIEYPHNFEHVMDRLGLK